MPPRHALQSIGACTLPIPGSYRTIVVRNFFLWGDFAIRNNNYKAGRIQIGIFMSFNKVFSKNIFAS